MATIKSLMISFIILLAVLHLAESEDRTAESPLQAESPHQQGIDCGVACDGRCRLSSRPNLCKRACGTCCARCHCVPPGTSGNYDKCPCYANLTTHGGRHKCP